MSKLESILIGKGDVGPIRLNKRRFIVTRGLVTADSGGGKSWLLRLILEGFSKTTQTIVIDPEGEFATLREARDMVLAGPDGEVPAEPRSAALLCRRLMELNLSAVIDIQELTPRARQEFVRNFCDTMVNLPKTLWQPCIVAIDEIHDFAPEDAKSESHDAVASLSTKGRKRGYCLLGATQRLSKLSKDVAAGLKNQFFGTFSLDADIKRAAASLGFGKDRWAEIRDLSSQPGREGEFFGVGPALNHRGVVKMRSGQVETTHPQAGVGRPAAPPAPSEKIKGVLGELKDLPQQAETEIRDMAAAKQKIRDLEKELKRAAVPAITSAPKVDPAEIRSLRSTVAHLKKGLEQAMKVIAEINASGFEKTTVEPEEIRKAMEAATGQIVKLVEQKLSRREAEIEKWKREATRVLGQIQKLLSENVNVKVDVKHQEPFALASDSQPAYMPNGNGEVEDKEGRALLTSTERAVLDAAASFPGGATRQRISIFSGRSIKSSSFQQCFAGGEAKSENPSLVQRGLLVQNGDKYAPSEAGAVIAAPMRGTTLRDWIGKLKPAEGKVLQGIADAFPDRVTRAQVAERTQQSTASSSFQAAFPALRELGLIEGKDDFRLDDGLVSTRKD